MEDKSLKSLDLSVVIPLYNKAAYIKRAVESVFRQTLSPKEIIIIDDGSTDGGDKKAKELRDPRIKIITQKNLGASAARNRGIFESFYDLIAFLDADDEWMPDFLERIQLLREKFPDCGAYATSAEVIRSDGSSRFPRLQGLPPEPWVGLIPDFFDLFQAGFAFNASSIVIPKSVLKEVEGFPAGIIISEDMACWVKIAIRYPIAFDPARAVLYHQDANNRVGHVHIPLQEMPYIRIIQEAIESGLIPAHLQLSALDLVAQKQIMVASQNVMASNHVYARKLLSTCRNTKRYRRDWLWWYFWAHWPTGWPYQLLKLKEYFREN